MRAGGINRSFSARAASNPSGGIATRMRPLLVATVIATLNAALVTGCTGTDSAGKSQTTSTVTEITASTAPQTAVPTTASTTPPTIVIREGTEIYGDGLDVDDGTPGEFTDVSLLASVFVKYGVATSVNDEVVARSSAVPEATKHACMEAAGFEYVEAPEGETYLSYDPRYAMSPEKFAAEYGLGIMVKSLGKYPEPPNPNHDVWATLTDGELKAWQAQARVCGDEVNRAPILAAADGAFEEFKPIVDADPRMVQAAVDWQECAIMTGPGSWDSPAAMREYYEDMATESDENKWFLFDAEVLAAKSNVECLPAYSQVARDVIIDRFDEYLTMYNTRLQNGTENGSPAQQDTNQVATPTTPE